MAAMESGLDHQSGGPIKDPLLELIIQKYTHAARDSIRGPVALKADLQIFSRNSPNFRNMDFKRPDPLDEHKARETSLDGYSVASFNVGGEKRLSFTQLVQLVLKEYNFQEICKRRDELLIFCSKSTPRQLDALKLAGVLPWTSTSSNLITKSDSYRLCGSLYGSRAPQGDPNKRSPISFEVYHECFGGCIGVFDPELYHDVNAPCIRCTDCSRMFSTRKFVSHNHMAYDEVHTCHWGFDSARWRSYLMLVEQKPSRELVTLWGSIKAKFDGNRSKMRPSLSDPKQDLDFVSYVQSPEQKKALVSPIESLRRRESRSLGPDYQPWSSDFYEGKPDDTDKKESHSSAFHPWSPTPSRSSVTSRSGEGHFRYPDSHAIPKHQHYSAHVYPGHSQCGCAPALSSSSSMYFDCQQCKNAAQVASCSGLHMLAQKASELPGELDVKPKLESGMPSASCGCEQCKRVQRDNMEACIEEVVRKFTVDLKLTAGVHELARVLSSEMKRLSINQEDKIRELSIGTQRLQTELHLVKTDYQKKLSEAMEGKARMEQELELVQRERQKDIARYNQLTWEFTQEVEKQKATTGERTELQLEVLQKEIYRLKHQLEESMIARDNLNKQLTWQLNKSRRKSDVAVSSTKMDVDKWTPFPTIGRKFSDSESDCEESAHSKTKSQTPVVMHTSHSAWTSASPAAYTSSSPVAPFTAGTPASSHTQAVVSVPSRVATEPIDSTMCDAPSSCPADAPTASAGTVTMAVDHNASSSSTLITSPRRSPEAAITAAACSSSGKRKLEVLDKNENRIDMDEDVDIEVEE